MRRVPRKHTVETVPWCQCRLKPGDDYSVTNDPKVCVHSKCGKPTKLVWEKHVAGRQA